MKLLPLIGALLLLATPVQAIETFEELEKVCGASEEIYNTCTKAGIFSGTLSWMSLLCASEAKGRLTREETVLAWNELYYFKYSGSPLQKEAAEIILKKFPDCSIKPWL